MSETAASPSRRRARPWARRMRPRCVSSSSRPGLDREERSVPGRVRGGARVAHRRIHAGARHRDRGTVSGHGQEDGERLGERGARDRRADRRGIGATSRSRLPSAVGSHGQLLGPGRRPCSSASTARRSMRSSTSLTRSRGRGRRARGGRRRRRLPCAAYRHAREPRAPYAQRAAATGRRSRWSR